MRRHLIRRFRQLWILELVNAFVIFPFVLYTIHPRVPLSAFTLVALCAVDVLLVVGAWFGYLKMRDLQDGRHRLRRYRPHFRWLRRFVPVLLVLVLLVLLPDVLTRTSNFSLLALVPRLLLYGLAVLEYINYFHTQLMVDNRHDLRDLLATRRLKKGLIAREYDWPDALH